MQKTALVSTKRPAEEQLVKEEVKAVAKKQVSLLKLEMTNMKQCIDLQLLH